MALSGSTVWDVRTGGSNTNGGGFVTGAAGTDHSQQDAAQYAVTDGVTNGSTAITSATANFGTDVVGNLVYVAGGTGSIVGNWYQITARPSTTEITVDRVTGLTTGTGATLNIGGALASPGLVAQLMTITGMRAWIKSGTYSITTATPGAGGPIQTVSGVVAYFSGYDGTRGDDTGTRPVLVWNASAPGAATYIVNLQGGGASAVQIANNIEADCNDVANVWGFRSVWRSSGCVNCVASNASLSSEGGFLLENAVGCRTEACYIGFSLNDGQAIAMRCLADGGNFGFVVNGGIVVDCVADSCANYGFSSSQYGRFFDCVAYDCGAEGMTGPGMQAYGCVSVENTGAGLGVTGHNAFLYKCATRNNSSRTAASIVKDIGAITLSADPFVDAVAGDFRPNATAGGGAELVDAGVGIPSTTNTFDIGALEASSSATGGSLLSANLRGNFQ